MRSRHAGYWAVVFGASGLCVLAWGAWRTEGVPALSSKVVWTSAGEGIPPLGEVEGQVVSVDAFRGLITLRVGGAPASFRVDTQTTVFLEGRSAQLAELSPGDAVKTTFTPGERVPLAAWVERVDRPIAARRPVRPPGP